MWTCSRYTRGRFERTHGSVSNLHTGVGGGGGEGGRREGSSPVLLTKQGPRGVFTFPREVHQKQPLDLTHLRFESRSRTTCHRFLQSFAISDKGAPLQLSRGKRAKRNVTNDLHVNIATSHHGNVIFRVPTLMLSFKPQHTNTYNITRRQRQTETERAKTTQRKAREDCRQLAILGESWLPITHACLKFSPL